MKTNIQKSIKAEVKKATEKMMHLTSEAVVKKSENDYLKVLLLIEMYKTGDEVILDGYFSYKEHRAVNQAKHDSSYGINAVISELQNTKTEPSAFYILSRCGRLSRQVLDYMLEYLETLQKENDNELFFADPDSGYSNDGYTDMMRHNYRMVLTTYLNMLSATIVKQRLYIAELRGEEMEPTLAKDCLLPEIERKFPYLTE